MATKLLLYPENDQLVTLERVTDSTGALVYGATISGKLVDKSGTEKVSLVFSEVNAPSGNYAAPLDAADVPDLGSYVLQVTGDCNGAALYFEVACTVQKRVL